MTDQALVSAPATSAPTVRLDSRGLLLGDARTRLPLFGGSMHYWQHDRADWESILRTIRSLGFRIVDTYIPWSVHEEQPGEFSFSGNLDVEAFLDLCHELGMFVIARPGPHINAELTEFGYPSRLVRDARMQARTGSGAPAIHVIPPKAFPIISYSSDEFFREVEGWFDAVCPIIARHQYPAGPIVLVQADNEHSYFFKLTPYDVDYSDSAIAQYRDVLRERYETVDALNTAYGTRLESFDELQPPRKFAAEHATDLPRYLDWAYAKERYLTDGVRRVASMLRERGVASVPISHNSPGWFAVPYNQVALEEDIDVHGVDFYVHRREYRYLKHACLYLAGTARLAFIPEFGAGTWPWWNPIDDLDAEANALAALMHGVRAINYYMLVERDRWLGSPIGRRGDVREDTAQLYRRVLAFVGDPDWTHAERRSDVLLLTVREYERFAFASRAVSPPFFPEALGPFADLARHELFVERTLGFSQWIPRELRRWFTAWHDELSSHHFGYALGDSESPLESLMRFSVLVAPGFEFMTQSTQEKLLAYVSAGGQLIIGPQLPHADESGAECTILAASGAPGIHVVERPHELASALGRLGIEPACVLDNPQFDVAVHAGGSRTFIFVANPTDTVQHGRLQWSGRELHDAWGDAERLVGDGVFDLALQPHQIQVWSC